MNNSAMDKLRALVNSTGVQRRAVGVVKRSTVKEIEGLPEFRQVTLPPIVAEYFSRTPSQHQYYVDRVSQQFRAGATPLQEQRAKHEAELRTLRSEHQDAAETGDHSEAERISSTIHRKEIDFENHYSKQLNLAKGSALVVANKELEKIESLLHRGEVIEAQADEAKLAAMTTDEKLIEVIKLLRK